MIKKTGIDHVMWPSVVSRLSARLHPWIAVRIIEQKREVGLRGYGVDVRAAWVGATLGSITDGAT